MRFYSTRDKNSLHSLKEAAVMGLAPDGGLFMPEYVPQVNLLETLMLAQCSFAEMSSYLASLFFKESITQMEVAEAISDALSFDVPLVKAGPCYTLELFHGPTCAFKDVGASSMGQILGKLIRNGQQEHDKPLIILTATSGDTGSAVARGFYDIPGIKVVVLFPNGKVSPLQECQMTALGKNIKAIKVNGTFDDCQMLVKAIFNNKELRKQINVTSANSINLLRWLPQSFYYFYAYAQWLAAEHQQLLKSYLNGENIDLPEVTFVVPSGNYGNISAGMLAKRMGLPVKGFVAAANSNDVFPKYLESGKYEPRPSVQTIANAMDVGAPSNFERIQSLFNNDYDAICKEVKGYAYSDSQIKEAILELHKEYGYTCCPHSATGYLATKEYLQECAGLGKECSANSIIWLSTASPAKFSEVIAPVTGQMPHIPGRLQELLNKEKEFAVMDVSTDALVEILKTHGE
ncbi:MAG: threonine synthase [Bacteroidales bacterium]|nr:threonine synthase [Bacteroidales bacterium]